MNKIDWVLKIAPLAVYCHKKYGYPTAALFAPCLETGYGERPLVKNANNIFGMKKELLPYESTVWNCDTVWADTWEDVNGQAVPVKAEFRKYASIRDCMEDFCQFMAKTEKYGSHVIGKSTDEVLDYLTGRYATDEHYGEKIKRIIEENGLRKFDRPNIPEPPAIIDHIAQNANQVPAHSANSHEYIAIHYLGVEGENPDLYNNGYGGHFYVSKDGKCYQSALVTDKIWHVGASSGYEYIHPFARNANTIGIECATYEKDGKWYFTEATQKAAAQLAAWLMFCLDIPATNLLRHGDITTKRCPAPYMDYGGQGSNWTWERFKEEVQMAEKEYPSLMPGSKGERVKWWQDGLLALGFADCGFYLPESNFANGEYGEHTTNFTARFQKYYGLTVDGCAGVESQACMEKELAQINLDKFDFTVEQLTENALKVSKRYRDGKFVWGSADIAPWLQPEVNKASCDRGWDEALHGLIEFGNREAKGIYDRLIELGAELITDISKVQAGDFIFHKNWHIFYLAGNRDANGNYARIDFGSTERMQRSQPSVEPIDPNQFMCGVRPQYRKAEPEKPTRKYAVTIEQVTLGMIRPSVGLLQTLLKGLGYYTGSIDNHFGTLTQAALNAYQAYWIAKGVDIGTDGKPDSICGRGCWQKLLGVEIESKA